MVVRRGVYHLNRFSSESFRTNISCKRDHVRRRNRYGGVMEFRLLQGFKTAGGPSIHPVSGLTGLTEVRAYWEGLRRDGGVPARTELDPRGMSGALDRVFVAERIGTGLVRIRIAGSALGDVAGLDLRGLPLSCLFRPESRVRLSTLVEKVFVGPTAVELHLEAERGVGRPSLDGRLMMLPLLDVDRSRSLMLGCFCFKGGLGRSPRRFALKWNTEEKLGAVADPSTPNKRPEADCPVAPSKPNHLRLVHSVD